MSCRRGAPTKCMQLTLLFFSLTPVVGSHHCCFPDFGTESVFSLSWTRRRTARLGGVRRTLPEVLEELLLDTSAIIAQLSHLEEWWQGAALR